MIGKCGGEQKAPCIQDICWLPHFGYYPLLSGAGLVECTPNNLPLPAASKWHAEIRVSLFLMGKVPNPPCSLRKAERERKRNSVVHLSLTCYLPLVAKFLRQTHAWLETFLCQREKETERKRVVSITCVPGYWTQNKCDNAGKLSHYLQSTNFGPFFFLTTFFKMSLFQLPLDKSLMRKSQRSSVFGLFVECQINYRKMYRLNLSHVLFFFQLGETTQNLRLYALNPELNLAEVF